MIVAETKCYNMDRSKSARDLLKNNYKELKMENKQLKISIQDLTKEIIWLIKEEIVATYTEEETAVRIHFLSGQSFRVSIEEIK